MEYIFKVIPRDRMLIEVQYYVVLRTLLAIHLRFY